ncbi:polysaccharide deacetylase family protein [Nitratireductor kimnyeongensis]|uniref:Chitooligosaccharide deacetylase n=1 Tax=Nitratireductor kimnyeongensis TaxID=430679 RepID=A0ABW0T9C8_9HYPH|nr:polysaccharide deacetylase family protein [Nitratireductor kimnyeongensis]QZZ35783.1 polysaccharide deacetylase family protein [Nitratireductor kimnyeongensis]
MPSLQALKRSARYELIRAGLEGTALALNFGLPLTNPQRGVIFALHHVDPESPANWAPNAWLSITPTFLEQAIEVCKEEGLIPIALEDLPERLADPQDTRRYVCFTLDDGYRDNARFAAPVFQRHAVPYTIFITSGFVERTRSIWWKTAQDLVMRTDDVDLSTFGIDTRVNIEQRAERVALFDRLANAVNDAENEDTAIARLDSLAAAHGIDPLAITEHLTMNARELAELAADPLAHFGAHTLTHANLTKVDDKRLETEMVQSAARVGGYVGAKPTTFAYPYGYASAVGAREIAAARQAGFVAAVTTRPGLLSETSGKAATALPRVSLNGFYQRKRYVRALLSGLPFRLRQT